MAISEKVIRMQIIDSNSRPIDGVIELRVWLLFMLEN